MSTIGGFLPLEIAAAGEPYHAGAAALASGRSCWHVIIRTCRPSRVLLPFYVCDAVLRPLVATGTPFEFYPITESLQPRAGCVPAPGELMLVVNYFGVLTPLIDQRAAAQPDRIVVDDTQAFFRRSRPGAWAFNSARKFFGVPDGGFLYGPAAGIDELPPSDMADCDHLLARLAGDDRKGWEHFTRREARIGIDPHAMSIVSARLLGAVDMDRARRTRQSNFEALHRALGPLNTIDIPLDDAGAEGPMCYPLLPSSEVDRDALHRLGVFVPMLWPDVSARGSSGFEWERHVAHRLLPLPIDHRYGPGDMAELSTRLMQVLT